MAFEYLAVKLLLTSFSADISPEGLEASSAVVGNKVVVGGGVVVDVVVVVVVVDGVGGARKISQRAPIRV
ncbi:unnamed protein product [Rodentolepis nana]|uniref:Uncharacterized protein n=1 Tax=Rodentolepis nana TaxID=102285 RepID=A0A0R3TW74_RODNA|nr:unnamed protein product [Rodentolepis nana]